MGTGRVADRVTIITGAGEGLGRERAVLFAAEGAPLVLAGRRAHLLEETAALAGGQVLVVPTDVTVEDQVAAMVGAAVDRFGRVDILLNNAAQPGRDCYIWEQTLENWNATLAIDVTAAMLCTREVLVRSMLERRSGAIVNFSSSAGWNGMPRKSHYSVAKAGLRTLTKVTAKEVGPYGIRANCVVPGSIDTELLRRYYERIAAEQGVTADEVAARSAAASALGRISTAEEVARVALFLASDDSRPLTGQSISTDAGTVMVG